MPDEQRVKLYGLVEMRLSLYIKIQMAIILTLAAGSCWAFAASGGAGPMRNLSYVFAGLAVLESLETIYYLMKK